MNKKRRKLNGKLVAKFSLIFALINLEGFRSEKMLPRMSRKTILHSLPKASLINHSIHKRIQVQKGHLRPVYFPKKQFSMEFQEFAQDEIREGKNLLHLQKATPHFCLISIGITPGQRMKEKIWTMESLGNFFLFPQLFNIEWHKKK